MCTSAQFYGADKNHHRNQCWGGEQEMASKILLSSMTSGIAIDQLVSVSKHESHFVLWIPFCFTFCAVTFTELQLLPMVEAGHIGKNLYAGVLVADEANKTHLAGTAGRSLCLRLFQTAVYQMGPQPGSMPAEKNPKGPLNKPVFTVSQESFSNEVYKNHVVQG